jgi:hypothetical protein
MDENKVYVRIQSVNELLDSMTLYKLTEILRLACAGPVRGIMNRKEALEFFNTQKWNKTLEFERSTLMKIVNSMQQSQLYEQLIFKKKKSLRIRDKYLSYSFCSTRLAPVVLMHAAALQRNQKYKHILKLILNIQTSKSLSRSVKPMLRNYRRLLARKEELFKRIDEMIEKERTMSEIEKFGYRGRAGTLSKRNKLPKS